MSEKSRALVVGWISLIIGLGIVEAAASHHADVFHRLIQGVGSGFVFGGAMAFYNAGKRSQR